MDSLSLKMLSPTKSLLFVACLCWLNGLVSCQEVTVELAGGLTSLLPGEQVTCVYVGFTSTATSTQWFLDGEPLSPVPNKIEINSQSLTSILTLLTDDAVVTGNYSCRVDFKSGIQREGSLFVPKAEYSLNVLGETTIKEGSNLSLLCNFTSERAGDAEAIFWNSTKLSRAGEVLMVTNTTSSLTGRYVCTVEFAHTSLTISTDVIIQSTPRINTPVIHSVVQTDSVATLVCNATGLGLTYTWLFNARPLQETSRSALNGENLTITGITFSDTGDYVCTASNKAGNVSQVHSLTVIGAPDIIAPNSTTVEVAVNNLASLFCRSVSYPNSNTSWMHYPAAGGDQPGRSVPGANTRFVINSSEELVIMSAAMEDAGAFQCNVTNEHGSATINITLIVVGPPLPPTDVRLAKANLTSVQLTWNQTVLPEFRRVEEYTVELSADGGPFVEWEEFEVTQGVGRSLLRVTGLTAGTEYRLRVWTKNLAGTSNTSAITTFSTLSNIPQLELHHNLNDNRSLILQWRLLYDGGSPVTNLDISLVAIDENHRLRFGPEIGENQLVVNGLRSSTTYTVTVTLSNEQGGSNSTVFNVITSPDPTPSPVLTTTLIIVIVTVPFVTLTILLSAIMCVVVCIKKLRVKKKGYPINPAPPSPTEHVNGGSISGNRLNNSLRLSNSHSQLDHNYQFQNSSLVHSVTPHLGMQESYSASTPRITRLPSMSESYSASVTRMHSMSENPPPTSVSNGHVPHFFSPISIENGSPKFSYPLPNNVHERQSSSTYSLPLSSVVHEETYV